MTEAIIGCAYTVHNTLGGGFAESVYERSLAIELRAAGYFVETQINIPVRYRDQPVGDFVGDALVERRVLCELKAVEAFAKAHEVQLVNYLQATGIDVGLLINFGPHSVSIKRKTRLRGHCESR
ncbi:MAG: GxxExxY protein [Planctomycetota bacterium]